MLGISLAEQQELFRRLAFNIFSVNVDDHTKNFSFMFVDGKWRITPAYDMTFTVNMDGSSYENRHAMTLLGKDEDITKDDLSAFAKELAQRAGFSVRTFVYDWGSLTFFDLWKMRACHT